MEKETVWWKRWKQKNPKILFLKNMLDSFVKNLAAKE